VFFFPSVTETFGIVTLEAMASGLPAVCANATGSASLVLPGETGYLIEDGEKPAFADAITRLVQDPALRRRMGGKAAVRSRDYSWRRAMETLEGYYYEVLATARSTST
jgi:glycosyltransferase involved in cell wall biosynthesis